MANDQENLDIRIGSDSSDIEGGSKAAAAAINKVTKEAEDLDKAFKRLRSSIDPMFAAQTQYNQSLAQLDTLLSRGAVSEAQYAQSVDLARAALARQSAEQLRGTAVANAAAEAQRTAAATKGRAEQAAAAVATAANRAMTTARAAEAAAATANEAREAKARTQIALQEAREKLAAARQAQETEVPKVNRNDRGQFVSRASVEAERAAAAEEAEEEVKLAQVEDTVAGQRVRNAQRVATTREQAALRAAAAEETAAEVSVAAAAEEASAAESAAEASRLLEQAADAAAQASLRAAAEQKLADTELAEATRQKAQAAAEAAIAEEREAAATAKAKEASAAAAKAAKEEAAAARAAAKEEASRAASADRLKASIDKAYAAQLRYNQTMEQASSLHASGHIDDATKSQVEANALKVLTDALKNNTGHAINNRAAYETLILVHEGLSRRWSRMSSSAMILGQALAGNSATASALTTVLSPLGLAAGMVVGTFAALSLAMYQGSAQQASLQRALSLTGQYAGMSSGEIDAAAKKIASSTNTSALEATRSLTQIAASGQVTGKTLVTMGEITQTLAEQTGQDASKIAADMVRMAEDPAAAMKELDSQYHFLSPTMREHIRNLIEQGDKTQAVAELATAFNSSIQSEKVELTGLAGVVHSVSVSMGDLWQSMMNIGKAKDPAVRLAEINKLLATNSPEVTAGFRGEIQQIHSVTELRQEAAEIQKKLNADQAKSTKTRLETEAKAEEDKLESVLTSVKSNKEKADKEKADWKVTANAAVANPYTPADLKAYYQDRLNHHSEVDARIDKKYDMADQPKKPKKGPSATSDMQQELEEQKNLEQNWFKDETDLELKFWTEKLKSATKGTTEYNTIYSRLSAARKKKAREDYADELAALKEKIESSKGSITQENAAWDTYLAKIKDVMGATSKEFLAAEKERKQALQRMAEDQAKMSEKKEKDAEQPVVRQYETQQTSQSLKGGALDYAHSQGMVSDRQYAEQKKALLEQEIQAEKAHEDELYQMKQAEFQKELSIANLSPEAIKSINEKIEAETQSHEDKLQQIRDKGLLDYQKANQEVSTATNKVWSSTYDAMASHLESSLKKGIEHGFNFQATMRGLALTVLDNWADMATKMLAQWVKSLLFQKTASAASTAVDVAGHTAGEAAKTTSTVVGTQARVTATTAGAAEERSVTATTAMQSIGANASKAAAGAYAAFAAIPIVGPVLGAAAAAATFAAVLAFGAFVSAEGGQAQVPYDGQMSMLHKDEMVLPAWAASPLRASLRAANGNGLFDTASQAGESARTSNNSATHTTFNYQPTHNSQDPDVDKMLRTQGKTFRKWIANEQRNGTIKSAKK